MLRLLPLLLFIILALFNPQARAGVVHDCDVGGYSTDKDPNGLNVRAGPGLNFKVVARLKRIKDDASWIWPEMELDAWRGDWVRISKAFVGLDGDTLFKGTGWVHVSRVATVSRGYETGEVVLRKDRSARGGVVIEVPRETDIGVRGCQGKWVLGEYNGKRGWLAPSDQCPTPATTCN